jgi:glycosyltransferase involved in cell wall biosynthesis
LSSPKRLLILCRHPAKASFRQRIKAYLEPLRRRGIDTETVELARSPLERRRQLLRAGRCDGIWLQKKTLTAWDALALRRRRARLIYDFDDAIMYKTEADQRRPNPLRLRRFRRTVRMTDLVIAGNGFLAQHARDAGAPQVVVIPTGLDIRRYRPKQAYRTDGPMRLVWIGSKSTLKQIRSFVGVLETLGQRAPGTILRVIADAGLEARHLAVENLPWSHDGEARMLAESDIGVAPLPDTPFTRGKCAFKIVQYMAAGLPVIASPVGVNADYVQHGRTGFWASDAGQWVEAFQRLAGDAALRESMGRAGRQRAEQELDLAVLAGKVCDAIEQCLRP